MNVNTAIWMILVAIVFIGALAALIILNYRKNIQNEMAELLQKLDDAIDGKIQENKYDESMNSAIVERLNKLVQVSGMQKNRAAKERDTIKSLISDISHQIRTPLTNIMLYIGLLRERELEEGTRELADKIQQQSEKLDFFMKELVKSAYTETEMIVAKPEKASVEELMARTCQTIEVEALKKGTLVEREESHLFCNCDMKWTVEALSNILENAIKYSPENSRIEIKAVPYESFVCIQIIDQGIGIREEELGLIFQRFYRSQDVKKEQGFGIGLYLAREIFARQGGYVKVQSKLGEGSTFCVFLPK